MDEGQREDRTMGYEVMDREDLREVIWPEPDDNRCRRAYDWRYVRLFGPACGLFLSRLVYYDNKGDDPDGWLFYTKEQIREEFGFPSVYAVDETRHRLEDAGVLETARRVRRRKDGSVRHPSPTLHYKVDFVALAELLDRFEANPEDAVATMNPKSGPSKTARSSTRRSRVRVRETHALESAKQEDSIHRGVYGGFSEVSSGSPGQRRETGSSETAKQQPPSVFSLKYNDGHEPSKRQTHARERLSGMTSAAAAMMGSKNLLVDGDEDRLDPDQKLHVQLIAAMRNPDTEVGRLVARHLEGDEEATFEKIADVAREALGWEASIQHAAGAIEYHVRTLRGAA